MTSHERRRRIEEVCDAALALDASARAAFVAAACGSDVDLRRQVEALLAHAETAEDFLAAPIGEVAAQLLAERPLAPLVGLKIGSHKILHLLGAGGMGEVYRANDTKLGRDVAIKVLADAFFPGPLRLARFEREARVLATLNHPHIAAIYGLEEADGVHALVLELVEGETLAERLARHPLPVPEALGIARQIADALEAAHDKGIIHCDLKPANIKITPDGVVKVLDFGVAKVFARDETESETFQPPTRTVGDTRDGVIAGTAAYMSVEQARGKPVDKRTDIWAFGCVLYEMLTGRAAFSGETLPDTIASVLEHDPDWTALPTQTPPNVRRLLQRCLEKDVKRRLRDIGDARLEIEEALAAPASVTGERVDPDGVGRSAPRAGRARLGWWASALALVATGSVAAWQLDRSDFFWRDPLHGATSHWLTDFGGAEHHAAISRDGTFVAFLSDRAGTWDAWVSQIGTAEVLNLTRGRMGELRNPATRTLNFLPDRSLLILWNRVPDAAKGRLVDTRWAVPTLGGELRPYLKGIANISELDWSPDGSRIVYHTPADGDPMFVTEPDENVEKVGRQIHVASKGFHNHFPVWSPDGAFIYFVYGLPLEKSDIWRIRPTGGQPERLTSHDSRVTFPTFLTNRTLLYLATDADGLGPWIYTIDVERRVARRISTGVDQYTSLAASTDGRRVVATVSRSTARLWRVPITDRVIDESGASPVVPPTASSLPTTSGLSPRRGPGYIVYRAPKAGRDGLWKIADGGAATELWNGLDGRAIAGSTIAPDGKRLAFVVQKREQMQLFVMNVDGTGIRQIAEALDVRGTPAWSPDGEWLAVAAQRDGEPRLFKVPVGGGSVLPLVNEYAMDPVWAPSGRFLVYSGADVGTNFPVKAVGTDGSPHSMPRLSLTRGARRLAFLTEDALIVLKGDVSHKDFWVIDLKTGGERQLTRLNPEFALADFDVSRDGREIIFDRVRESSDIVLFELPGR